MGRMKHRAQRLPLGADSPYQGEMSRRDKEGRDRWPREAGSDEGQGALTHCNANGNCSPTLIRLPPVGTFPQGKAGVHPASNPEPRRRVQS